MRKTKFKSYLFLLVAFIILLSLPVGIVKFFRNSAIALTPSKNTSAENTEIARLQLENQLLSTEIQRLQSLIQQEHFHKDLQILLQNQLVSIPAKVIFRSPINWENSLWIDVGEKSNESFGRTIVEKNSPVILGRSIVGLVEEVHPKKSRVRLITDPLLTPSVRAVRNNLFLAKGELQGCATLKKRARSTCLKGTGFNYDFSDRFGPARDLRTGEPVDEKGDALPIIDINDLLITTGLDGVFPEGFHVATVSKIIPLKEGDFYYDIEAIPTTDRLNDLSYVFVLPPMGHSELLNFQANDHSHK